MFYALAVGRKTIKQPMAARSPADKHLNHFERIKWTNLSYEVHRMRKASRSGCLTPKAGYHLLESIGGGITVACIIHVDRMELRRETSLSVNVISE